MIRNANIIVMNGKPRAGKDTAVMFMRHLLISNDEHLTYSFSAIDPVKTMLATAGIDCTGKTEKDRNLLATIGDLVEEHSEFKTKECLRFVRDKIVGAHHDVVVFVYMREPDMIAKFKKLVMEDASFKMSVAGVERITFSTVNTLSNRSIDVSNDADSKTDDYEYDYSLFNMGSRGELLDSCLDLLIELGLLKP